MIVCPNCNHHNPEGATQCEACYTPLPEMVPCPNCGAPVQVDANFCGQCGFHIQSPEAVLPTALEVPAAAGQPDLPELEEPEPLSEPEPVMSGLGPEPETEAAEGSSGFESTALVVPKSQATTQLQTHRAMLLHVRTNVALPLPENLSVIHLGKPNDRVPPDLDVSGFPDSEVVSRIHADIRVEGDAFYIEDVGSSNGTYVNNLPLAPGNRHRLRVGDRIAFGKGDLVTFFFQVG